ncbi:hypothetical protein CNMCM8927_001155 [Aspergillus lentulus]|uniref:Uncharacterized protein n=1 Tax=Aspergillus lentulus TaxID=293939 RepID=A0AAN6BRS2_ASPLE|nr:hypothetical protein CNMCM8927_001155 [Aspergillus lentulus]
MLARRADVTHLPPTPEQILSARLAQQRRGRVMLQVDLRPDGVVEVNNILEVFPQRDAGFGQRVQSYDRGDGGSEDFALESAKRTFKTLDVAGCSIRGGL